MTLRTLAVQTLPLIWRTASFSVSFCRSKKQACQSCQNASAHFAARFLLLWSVSSPL